MKTYIKVSLAVLIPIAVILLTAQINNPTTSAAPSGAAGGSLGGTYPNPTLSSPVSIPGATSGNVTLTAPAIAGTATNPLSISNSIDIPSGSAVSFNADAFLSRSGASTLEVGSVVGGANGGILAARHAFTGTKFTASGCTNGTTLGGAAGGSFLTGASGACAVTITMGSGASANTGWSCWASDATTTAGNPIPQTGAAANTTATISLPAGNVSGDLIRFGCMAY